MRVRLRPASGADSEMLANLSGQLDYPADAAAIRHRVAEISTRVDHYLRLAEIDGNLVAWIQAERRVLLESDVFGEIVGFVVDESCRGRGVGRRLLESVAAWCVEQGFDRLVVRVQARREASVAFYRHVGFEWIKHQNVLQRLIDRG